MFVEASGTSIIDSGLKYSDLERIDELDMDLFSLQKIRWAEKLT